MPVANVSAHIQVCKGQFSEVFPFKSVESSPMENLFFYDSETTSAGWWSLMTVAVDARWWGWGLVGDWAKWVPCLL